MAKQSPRTNTLLVSYLLHHIRVFFSSLGHLTRNPVASLMTSTVIAIALSLPAIHPGFPTLLTDLIQTRHFRRLP